MSAKIHFIGTDHFDQHGPERLRKALTFEQPNAIAVECSPDLWQYINSGKWLTEEKKILKIYRQRGMTSSAYKFAIGDIEHRHHFEPRISLRYGIKHSVPVHLVDSRKVLDEILAQHASPSRGGGNVDMINQISNTRYQLHDAETTYTDFSVLFSGSVENALFHEYNISAAQHQSAFIGRDMYAERKIRALVKEDMKLVVVYGIAHCLHDRNRNSLFSRLQDFSPTREVLKWYEDK